MTYVDIICQGYLLIFLFSCSASEVLPRIQVHTVDTVETCTHEVCVINQFSLPLNFEVQLTLKKA